jgi:septal ring factor EnvC (AmiA/AmiB activator)
MGRDVQTGMKRSIIWSSLFATSLLFTACKKKENDPQAAANEVQKTREEVRDQQKDVAKEQTDVNNAKQDLAKAKADFQTALNNKVTELNAKIDRLEAKGDEKSKQMAADFRARRDAAKARLNEASNTADDKWDAFKSDVSTSWDKLESDVNDALK